MILSLIAKILAALTTLWQMFKVYNQRRLEEAAKKAEQKRLNELQAIAKLEHAQTEDEFDEAQDAIVRNHP